MAEIPENQVEFCRKVAALAAQYGVKRLALEYWPDMRDGWRDKIHMNWEQGRHFEDAEKFTLSSTVQVVKKVEGAKLALHEHWKRQEKAERTEAPIYPEPGT